MGCFGFYLSRGFGAGIDIGKGRLGQ